MTAEYRYDAALLTSEPVTIAVMHAGGPCSRDATWTDERLHVEVLDTEPELPAAGVRGIVSGLDLEPALA